MGLEKMRKLVHVLCAVLILVSVSAQERLLYPSFLKVAVKENEVKLTWRDVDEISGERYRIYRHGYQIDEETFEGAVLAGEVDEGVQFFLDTPQPGGDYYYAVLAVDREGREHRVFIPFRNITVSPVSISAEARPSTAELLSLSGRVEGSTIVLTFRASREDRTLIIYRHTRPFTSPADLREAVPVDRVPSSETSYLDQPVAGIPYYYAVVDSLEVERGETAFVAGKNTTGSPLEIPLEKAVMSLPEAPSRLLREAPLPYLAPGTGSSARSVLPQTRTPLTLSTRKSLEQMLSSLPASARIPPSPEVLPEEESGSPETPIEAALKSIAANLSSPQTWAASEQALLNMLSLTESSELEARIFFYLGQVLFFQGKKEQAVLSFLMARDTYYVETTRWLRKILSP